MELDQMVEAIHKQLKQSGPVTCSSKSMTLLDELTHNFTGEPHETRYMLEKHGQVFIGGRRIEL